MAWITPITNRTNGSARMTYVDVNRITGNIVYLAEEYLPGLGYDIPAVSIKSSWTNNDIITRDQWAQIRAGIIAMADIVILGAYTAPTYAMTWDNINLVESLMLRIYEDAPLPHPVALSIKRPPRALSYATGTALDLTGLIVAVTMQDGTEQELSSDEYSTTPANGATLSASTFAITVRHGNLTTRQSISVSDATTTWVRQRMQTAQISMVSNANLRVGGNTKPPSGATVTVAAAMTSGAPTIYKTLVRYKISAGISTDLEVLDAATVVEAALARGTYDVDIKLSSNIPTSNYVRVSVNVADVEDWSFDSSGSTTSASVSATRPSAGSAKTMTITSRLYRQMTASHYTVLYEDGTLVINEPTSQHSANEAAFGSTTHYYPSGFTAWFPSRTNDTSLPVTAEVAAPMTSTSLYYAFRSCSKLTRVSLENLAGEYITSAESAFMGCAALTGVDMSTVNFTALTNTRTMFTAASALTKITAGVFETEEITQSANMFSNCTALVGGAGTPYDAAHVDKEYARIDNPPDAPGYFTAAQ